MYDDSDTSHKQSSDENDDVEEFLNPTTIQQTSTMLHVTRNKSKQLLIDEYLSDDDESFVIQPETESITLISILERVYSLMCRCRQLVSDIRNITVVQSFVCCDIKKGRIFSLDMQVNSRFIHETATIVSYSW